MRETLMQIAVLQILVLVNIDNMAPIKQIVLVVANIDYNVL